MKIPSKITKRQYTALNKKNLKYLEGEIWNANHDYTIHAENLVANDRCFKAVDDIDDYKETTNYYRVELNKAFRSFITDRNRIFKAYQKGLKK